MTDKYSRLQDAQNEMYRKCDSISFGDIDDHDDFESIKNMSYKERIYCRGPIELIGLGFNYHPKLKLCYISPDNFSRDIYEKSILISSVKYCTDYEIGDMIEDLFKRQRNYKERLIRAEWREEIKQIELECSPQKHPFD